VSGTVKFTIGGASDQAIISRGRVRYASGVSVPTGHGRSELLLTPLQRLRSGAYTLTVRSRHGRGSTTRRLRLLIS
jgi:hypothetical protein